MPPGIRSEYVQEIDRDETFKFGCHPGVPCFNECCRMLELALTPYDVLRLKTNLGITSKDFLDRYAIIEQDQTGQFPQVYLGMVDDDIGSCPFVSPTGCSVYADRPGACRTYPLGRGAFKSPDGSSRELFVLLREPHCRGFSESPRQTISNWNESQGLAIYNEFNDAVMSISHHEKIKRGLILEHEMTEKYILALYNLDDFRAHVNQKGPKPFSSLPHLIPDQYLSHDSELLTFNIQWLRHELFGE